MHVCTDMSAAGRLSNATTSIHPGRPCGPECSICSKVPSDKRFTHGSMLSDWQKLHTCISITSGQCICWKCVKALRRQGCTAAKENKPPVCQSTCSVDLHDCSAAAYVHNGTLSCRQTARAQSERTVRSGSVPDPLPNYHYQPLGSSVWAMEHVLGVSRVEVHTITQVEVTKLSACRACVALHAQRQDFRRESIL